MQRLSTLGRTVVSVLALAGCTGDPAGPGAATRAPQFAVGDSCATGDDVNFGCAIMVDGSGPAAAGFTDETGWWQYWSQPAVGSTTTTAVWATVEYRYQTPTAFGIRVVDTRSYDVGGPNAMYVETNVFPIKYVREAIGSKFVGFAGWDGTTGHAETRYCVANPLASGFECVNDWADPTSLNKLPEALATGTKVQSLTSTQPAIWTFDGSASYDPENNPLTRTWFVNGTQVGTGTSKTYTFSSAGTYTVRLLVDDGAGGIDAFVQNVVVPAPGSPNPLAVYSIDGPSLTRPKELCGWTVYYGGGVAPYTFRWYKNGYQLAASGESVQLKSADSFTLYVTVQDATGDLLGASLSVTVDPSRLTACISA